MKKQNRSQTQKQTDHKFEAQSLRENVEIT